jgi:dihydropteroate synthase
MKWSLPQREVTFGRMPLIMGILNVTPDSFSDGGSFDTVERAVAHGIQLIEDGADILDVGGESTRPNSEPVSEDEELRRVLPVIDELSRRVKVPISIDTTKARVALEAFIAGAEIINDVSGLTADPSMVEIARLTEAGLIVMHMQGTPQTMQLDPRYEDVVREVREYLELRLAELTQAGIAAERVVLDPGIGFGKRQQHNLQLLGHLDALQSLGRPVCLGVSRKGFINRILGRQGHAEHGDFGTVGVVLHAVSQGWVQVARVHNVKALHDAAKLFLAMDEARGQG